MASSLLDLDPTGTLSAVGAGVRLVGAAVRLGTAAKKFNDSRHPNGAPGGGLGGGAGTGGGAGGPQNLHRSHTNPTELPTPKDPERERRAYETVNFVLREFGSRICAAGMVDEHALTKALTAATQHIEVNLFSGEANRLFESLAPKLDDPILVNSVFTSIYFIGALSAELSTSLPNYKSTYTPIGPRLVQQLFRAAIGEDAFRDNLSANLDAYKTLTTTAGLLRPTDIGYSTFPRFPSFSPCRYSGRGFTDVRLNKTVYEKLVKHFTRVGFPQPTQLRQAEVGLIRDWKFLAGDANSRTFDVDKADKNIGENFGRVIHWLICNAERLPPGTAVIAYYDQHIELIKWIQHRMGYAVLFPATDLDLGGPHAQLERRLRTTIESWVILMPSEAAQAAKRANAEHWMSTHIRTAAQAPPFVVSKAAVPRPMSMAVPTDTPLPAEAFRPAPPTIQASSATAQAVSPTPEASRQASQSILPASHNLPPSASAVPPGIPTFSQTSQVDRMSTQAAYPTRQPSQASSHSASGPSIPNSTNRPVTTVPTSPQMSSASSPPGSPAAIEMPTQGPVQFPSKIAEQQVEEIEQQFKSALVPQFYRLWSNPSSDVGIRDSQCKVLDHTLERETIDRLDRIEIPENSAARLQRKRLVDQAQELLDFLPAYKELGLNATQGRPLPGALQAFAKQTNTNITAGSVPQVHQSTRPGPPPYQINAGTYAGMNPSQAITPVVQSKPSVIRRKAPPPPKKVILAKALYDFEPDADNDEELGFNENDEIEIIEKNAAMEEDGWCRARVKGAKKIGLVPLEYLRIEEIATSPPPKPTQQTSVPVPPGNGVYDASNSSGGILSPTAPMSTHHNAAHQSLGMPIQSHPVHHQPNAPSHPHQPTHMQASSASSHVSPHTSTSHSQIQPMAPNTAQSQSPHPQQPFISHLTPQQQPTIVHSPHPGPQGSPHGLASFSQSIANNTNAKANAANVALEAIGAVGGAGVLLKGVEKLAEEEKHFHGTGMSSNPSQQPSTGHNDERYNRVDNGNVFRNAQNDSGNMSNYDNVGTYEPVVSSNDTVPVPDTPPMVDLSAFGQAPFDPQNAVTTEDQYFVPQEAFVAQSSEADFTATSIADYNSVASTTEVFQDTSTTDFVDGPAPSASPFASLATTSTTDTTNDTISYTDTTVTSGDGVTSTFVSITEDQTYCLDDTVDDDTSVLDD